MSNAMAGCAGLEPVHHITGINTIDIYFEKQGGDCKVKFIFYYLSDFCYIPLHNGQQYALLPRVYIVYRENFKD